MGENKHIEELDAFAKKYIKEIELDSPSLDFNANLMNAISKQDSKVFKAAPLISKKIWFLILVAVVALFLIPTNESEGSLFNLSDFNFSFLDKIQIPNFLESFSISNTVFYALFFFGLMIIAQVVFLKNHFNKRFE